MSWRIVVITKHAKLSYRNGHLIIREEETSMIHLSEINTLLIDSTEVCITTYLISELIKEKIKIIFCDEKRNPQAEVVPYYGAHNSSKRISNQINWKKEVQLSIWTSVIEQKISNQLKHLKKQNLSGSDKLSCYVDELLLGDITNREGHAAKVYFNALFGKGFNRDTELNINSALNYGYSILLSNFNKEIISNGYLTQLGIKHCNEFNHFNLASDIMEPFRILVDEIVYEKQDTDFDHIYKIALVDLLNKKVTIDGKEQYLTNAISIYVRSVFNALENEDASVIKFYKYI